MSLLYEERQMLADLEDASRTILVCSECGAVSHAFDAKRAPHAWDDWTVAIDPKCPQCNGVAKTIKEKKNA